MYPVAKSEFCIFVDSADCEASLLCDSRLAQRAKLFFWNQMFCRECGYQALLDRKMGFE